MTELFASNKHVASASFFSDKNRKNSGQTLKARGDKEKFRYSHEVMEKSSVFKCIQQKKTSICHYIIIRSVFPVIPIHWQILCSQNNKHA